MDDCHGEYAEVEVVKLNPKEPLSLAGIFVVIRQSPGTVSGRLGETSYTMGFSAN
jgi:hypothetical protein